MTLSAGRYQYVDATGVSYVFDLTSEEATRLFDETRKRSWGVEDPKWRLIAIQPGDVASFPVNASLNDVLP